MSAREQATMLSFLRNLSRRQQAGLAAAVAVTLVFVLSTLHKNPLGLGAPNPASSTMRVQINAPKGTKIEKLSVVARDTFGAHWSVLLPTFALRGTYAVFELPNDNKYLSDVVGIAFATSAPASFTAGISVPDARRKMVYKQGLADAAAEAGVFALGVTASSATPLTSHVSYVRVV